MFIQQQVLTFAVSPQVLSGLRYPLGCRIYAEPLGTNTHVSYTGIAGALTKATGAGVIKQHGIPSLTPVVVADGFSDEDQGSHNSIDWSQYAFDGTSGEKMLVTVWFK